MHNKHRDRKRRVDTANKDQNLLAGVLSDRYLSVGADQLAVNCYTPTDIPPKTRQWELSLLERNMRAQYESTANGWDLEFKTDEMFSPTSRHLVLERRAGEDETTAAPVAFSHFRFDMDYGLDVVYCYEIQIEEAWRRRGLGRQIVTILEKLVEKYNMEKLVLTVFKINTSALEFYKSGLGFQLDETNPDEPQHYEILSKVNATDYTNKTK